MPAGLLIQGVDESEFTLRLDIPDTFLSGYATIAYYFPSSTAAPAAKSIEYHPTGASSATVDTAVFSSGVIPI